MNSYSLMNNIRMLQFAAIELNLYLDNFPENKEATKKYKEISPKLDELINDYEVKYGPIRNFGDAYVEIQLLGLNHHGHGKNKGKGEVNYVVLC